MSNGQLIWELEVSETSIYKAQNEKLLCFNDIVNSNIMLIDRTSGSEVNTIRTTGGYLPNSNRFFFYNEEIIIIGDSFLEHFDINSGCRTRLNFNGSDYIITLGAALDPEMNSLFIYSNRNMVRLDMK